MDKIFCIALFLVWYSSFSQSKEQLIDSIVSENSFHSDCLSVICEETEVYYQWKLLKDKLSNKELIDLSRDSVAVLRAYAISELISKGNYPVSDLFEFEIQKSESVETVSGCLTDIDELSSIVYHEYWNKIRIESIKDLRENSDQQEILMEKRLSSDVQMEKLDSIVIYKERELDWLLYLRAFENRKHKESYLSRITELAFQKNNFYAFQYLQKHYPERYKSRLNDYLTDEFPKADFNTSNDIFYLYSFIKILLGSNNKGLQQVAIKKIRDNDIWKKEKASFLSILKKHGFEI